MCIYPKYLNLAKHSVTNTDIKLATVVNFPSGEQTLQQVLADIEVSIANGADEIDAVLPYKDFLQGRRKQVAEFLKETREACADKTLKIILETGVLSDREIIYASSMLAIEHGADFIKTSTGQVEQGASLDAAKAMLDAIQQSDVCGLKISGGVRTHAHAQIVS